MILVALAQTPAAGSGGFGFLQDLYLILNTPGGLLILFMLIGVLGYRGVWRWGREITERDAQIVYLKTLVERAANAAGQGAKSNAKAVEVIKRQGEESAAAE